MSLTIPTNFALKISFNLTGDQPEAERVATSETGMGPPPGGDEETVTAERGEGEEPYGDDREQDDDDAEGTAYVFVQY